MKNHATIELLEPRIAPATISIVGKTATWTDHDGDIVTMKWTSADAPAFTTMDKGDGLLASRILLDPAKHDGASFTVTVKAAGTFGDGRVELGHLDGDGVTLKSWVGAKAAISEVDLGVGNVSGLATFISGGIGQTKIGFFTGSMGNGLSAIKGNTKLVKIMGDIGYGGLILGETSISTYGSVLVTGNLRGDLAAGSTEDGTFFINGNGTSVMIGGSIIDTALQQIGGFSKSTTVKGDIVGLSTSFPNSLKAVKTTIGGSIYGSIMRVNFNVTVPDATVTVGGSIVATEGATQTDNGVLNVYGDAKSVTVKGSLRGANFATWVDSGTSVEAGAVVLLGSNVGKLTIGGSIHAGKIADFKPGVNGGIQADGNIKAITIGGSVIGSDRAPAYILAAGNATGTTGDYNAIGKLTIKGDATHAFIAAGTTITNSNDGNANAHIFANNPDAGIGSIYIGGNFNTSNVFAGVIDGGSPGVNNTALGDTLAVGDAARTAKLGPVVIKGHLLSERDSFYFSGFAADSIASIVVAGRKIFKAGDGLRNFDTFLTAREL